MITVYKDDKTQEVHGVDLDAWLDDEWTLEPHNQSVASTLSKINLNNADATQLRLLGVSTAIAKKLMDNRPLTAEKIKELGIEIDSNLIYFGEV